ncbi:MAG: PH domain-containing protein [Fusobacteriaceae bacterium]|nr:PH domain-containing protein [Fusobacteriaceae bacterium]MBN2837453.1 PH domain-containing protein [Fusobacteriaceae bacterium]
MGLLNALLGNASEVSLEALNKDFGHLLADGEQIEAGYQLIRDGFFFTNKRLVYIDKQGVTGKKISYMSIMYKNISRFAVETAGNFDLDAELKIWISGEALPSVNLQFNKNVNVYNVQKILIKHL